MIRSARVRAKSWQRIDRLAVMMGRGKHQEGTSFRIAAIHEGGELPRKRTKERSVPSVAARCARAVGAVRSSASRRSAAALRRLSSDALESAVVLRERMLSAMSAPRVGSAYVRSRARTSYPRSRLRPVVS